MDVDLFLTRSVANDLDRSAWALASFPTGAGPPPRSEGWAAAGALTSWAVAVGQGLGAVGASVAFGAGLIRTAAADYEAADQRAAGRLGRVG